MKILIVDDARAVHAFIREALLGYACELDQAFNGKEALVCLKTNPDYTIILLDWEMPVLSGIETLREVRKQGIQVPVIMVTSRGEASRIQEALEAGANDYIIKPFTRDILIEKIQAISGEVNDHI